MYGGRNMRACLENKKESSKELLKLTSKLKKMAKPKINFQNFQYMLGTYIEKLEVFNFIIYQQ